MRVKKQDWLKSIYQHCEEIGISKTVIQQFEKYYFQKSEELDEQSNLFIKGVRNQRD